jgi:L-ascorbate metabolism protein UlaG (beta-lactamase superfamily)
VNPSEPSVNLLKPAEKAGKKFLNPVPTQIGGFSTFLKVFPLYLRNKAQVEPKLPLGPFVTDAKAYATPPSSGLRVTWFGHSASLIEIDGMRVLIDPVWEQRASPFSFMGPKRFFPPTLALDALPPIDVVLISHDHYDHLGAQTARTLSQLAPQARWVTPLAVGPVLRGFGVAAERITELNWAQSIEVVSAAGRLRIDCWPARHFSGRSATNRFETLWGSFVLEGPQHRVYYGADSGPWPGIGAVAEQYPGFDLTMLEIGASHPLWADIHLGPDAAAQAFLAMGNRGRLLMPIHWGLFNLALHAWKQPMERMLQLTAEHRLPLWSPVPGEPTEVVAGTGLVADWWQGRA